MPSKAQSSSTSKRRTPILRSRSAAPKKGSEDLPRKELRSPASRSGKSGSGKAPIIKAVGGKLVVSKAVVGKSAAGRAISGKGSEREKVSRSGEAGAKAAVKVAEVKAAVKVKSPGVKPKAATPLAKAHHSKADAASVVASSKPGGAVRRSGGRKVTTNFAAGRADVGPARPAPISPSLKPNAMAGVTGGLGSGAAMAPGVSIAPPATGTNTMASLGGADVSPASSYGKALKFLATLSDYEHRRIVRYNPENFNLDRVRALLKRLGDPHTRFRSVHVAGTKGKGSTCTMVASMLEANGYKTGLYTSPHLVDIRERITVNGEMISKEDFSRLVRLIEPHVQKVKPLPTYFDVLTALAFMYFAEQKVELAVIETGLGGRLDSTNVITPEVTAITSISYDHMAQLGNTLEKIAAEKAGIFKPGIPAVTCIQSDSVEAVLRQTAEAAGAPFDVAGKSIEFSYRFESSRLAGPHFRLCLTTPLSKFEHLAVPMVGEHQAVNCGLALAIIDRLKGRGLALSDARCIEGLSKAYIPGRMELVSQTPRIIVDGAHNAASIDALIKSIGQHIPYDSMVLIFGCCGDKDVKGMLEKIASGADKVIFTRVNNIRSAEPEDLAHRYNEMFGKMCQVAPTLEGALSIARRAVTKEDLICITGSFYLVGEAKKIFPKPATMSAVPAATPQNLVAAGAGA